MVIFEKASLYIDSKQTLSDKIQAVQNLLSALDSTEMDAVLNENKTMYILDDGQTKVQVEYRGIEGMERARMALEKRLQRLINQYNGRVMRAIPGQSINRPNWPYGGR